MDSSFSLNICIAGINFHVNSGKMPVLRGVLPETYRPFISDLGSPIPATERIDVFIEAEAFPDPSGMTKIFETDETWTMFREGDRYLWVDKAEYPDGDPVCEVDFMRRPDKVTVYCRGHYLTGGENNRMVLNPIRYPTDQLLLMYALAERGGVCVHASAAELKGKGYLFPGRSGAGKSTISRIFSSRKCVVLSDDRIIVRKVGRGFSAFGTPWAGDAEIAENRELPLDGIFFIVHGKENRIDSISRKESFERLMPVTSIPWYDEKVAPDILSFCEELSLSVPAYDLHFRPESEVVDLLEYFV